jgi:hypothetical protein
VKAERPAHRVVPLGRFERLDDMDTVVDRLFGCETVERHKALLLDHLATCSAPNGAAWIAAVRNGDFDAIPEDIDWESSAELAMLIDGYQLLGQAGLGDPNPLMERALAQAQSTGHWPGDAMELWITLFLEHRRWRFSSPFEPDPDSKRLLDTLCSQLRAELVR